MAKQDKELRSCMSCRYWHYNGNAVRKDLEDPLLVSRCRFNPPANGGNLHPITDANFWCGQYKQNTRKCRADVPEAGHPDLLCNRHLGHPGVHRFS